MFSLWFYFISDISAAFSLVQSTKWWNGLIDSRPCSKSIAAVWLVFHQTAQSKSFHSIPTTWSRTWLNVS